MNIVVQSCKHSPGQGWVLQSSICTTSPVQSSLAAPSVRHSLILLRLPPPHVREQSVHGDQSDQVFGLVTLSSMVKFARTSPSTSPGASPKLNCLTYMQVSQHWPSSLNGALLSEHFSIFGHTTTSTLRLPSFLKREKRAPINTQIYV